MKKISQVFLIGLLSVFVTITALNSNVKAASTKIDANKLSEKELNEALMKNGTPVNVISDMDVTLKRSIVSKGGIFKSSKTIEKNIVNKPPQSGQVPNSPYINYATIPASKLTLKVSSFELNSREIYVTASYNWNGRNNLPLWRGNDLFGITYDSSKFTLVKSQHMDMYSWGHNNENVGRQTNEINRCADAGRGYIYWNANLRGYNYDVNNLWGWGAVTLRSSSSNKSSQVYMRYSHITGVGSAGFSYGGATLNFVGNAGHDDATIWDNIPNQ